MEPKMSFVERLMLVHYLRKATRYAEYGSGGSTTIANIFRAIVSIVSIESDPEYAAKVHKLAPRAKIRHIDVGPIGDHGHPVDDSKKPNWPSYSAQDLGNPDLVLVDGRWRVACICHVIRNYPTASLLVHDFAYRPEYHVVLDLCDIVHYTDTLVSLKRKEGVSDQAIADLYEAYKYEQA